MKGIGLKEEIDLSGHTVEKNALEGMGSDSRRLVYFDNSRKKWQEFYLVQWQGEHRWETQAI